MTTVVTASTPHCPMAEAKASASRRRLGTGGVLVDRSWRQCTKMAPGICPVAYKASPRGCASVGDTIRASIMRRLASCRWAANQSTLTKIWRSGRRGISIPSKERASAGEREERGQERGALPLPTALPCVLPEYARQRREMYHILYRVNSGRGTGGFLAGAGRLAYKDVGLFEAFSCP